MFSVSMAPYTSKVHRKDHKIITSNLMPCLPVLLRSYQHPRFTLVGELTAHHAMILLWRAGGNKQIQLASHTLADHIKASYYYYHHNYCIISIENIISRHCLIYHVPLNCISPLYICYGLNVSVPIIPMLDLILCMVFGGRVFGKD